jgi:hypothetical protein
MFNASARKTCADGGPRELPEYKVSDAIIEYYLQTELDHSSQLGAARRLAARHGNLRVKDGHGMSAANVQLDSVIKDGDWTHPKSRQMLDTRVFTAVPNLSRGSLCADAESELIFGTDTSLVLFPKATLAEVDYDRMIPGFDGSHDVTPPFVWGGASSRDIVRSAGAMAP